MPQGSLFDDGERNVAQLRSIISNAISALKHSIERNVPQKTLDDPSFQRVWRNSILKVENIRINLSSAFHPRQGFENERLGISLRQVRRDLEKLLQDEEFLVVAGERPYRWARPLGSMPRSSLDDVFKERRHSIPEAIIEVLKFLDYVKGPPAVIENGIQALKGMVPDQKIAPAQFAIKDDKLTLVHQPASAEKADAANVAHSREALLARGQKLLEELQRSNCDPRLLSGLKELQEDLARQENIIQLGLMNVGCEAMCCAFDKELPDALRGMLSGHTRGVAMYVAQFPEWQRFSENAASVNLGTEDIRLISDTASRLAADLEQNPDIADAEVPRTIRALQQLIDDPARASKRAAFAMLRTIENLVAKALQYCADLIEKTMDRTIEGLSKTLSKAAIVTLMTVALTAAVDMSPLASKVADTGWLRTAAEIVRNQIEAMKK